MILVLDVAKHKFHGSILAPIPTKGVHLGLGHKNLNSGFIPANRIPSQH